MDRLSILIKRSKIVFKPFFVLGNVFILPGNKNQSWTILARNSAIYFSGTTLGDSGA